MAINETIKRNLDKYCGVDVTAFQKRIAEEYSVIGDHPIYGGKYAGSDAERAGADYIAKELEAIGVDNVEVVEFDSRRFQFNDATLEILEGMEDKIIFKPGPYVSPGTVEDGITAEIVDAGMGMPEWYEENDVKGKIVFVESKPTLSGNALSYNAVLAEANGAAAIIILQNGASLPDKEENDKIMRSGSFMKSPKVPVVGVTPAEAEVLRAAMANGKVVGKLTVDGELVNGAPSKGVIAEIKGKTDERIIFSGHIDHYFRCMQDNISSVTGMLGIAKSIVDCGYKPNRTITFMFTSSHEMSGKESLNPYIYGSYVMLCERHPEWITKIVCDINFEYSALREKALRSYGSPEIESTYNEFIEYMPEETPGFGEIAKDFDPHSYILMAWEDSVSYVASGVTTICNDPITEQMGGDSPYIGRDHSMADNWDAFDLDALNTTTKWYGSLGLYIDQIPVPKLDFRGRTAGLRMTENEQPIVDAYGYDLTEYNGLLDSIDEKAGAIYEALVAVNGDRFEVTAADSEIVDQLFVIRHKYSALTDRFNAVGFFSAHHKKYIMSAAVLSGGIEMLKAGDLEGAMTNCLGYADLCGTAYQFGIAAGKMLEELAADEDSRTWNKNKTTSILVLPETMESLRKKGNAGIKDFADEIKELEAVLASEAELMLKSLDEAVDALKEINEDMAAFLKKIA